MATTRVEPAVCFGSSQRSWVTDLINYVSDHGGMRVVGTVLSQDDALEMVFDVLVIDDVSSVLSPRLVDRLHATNRIVVGVYDAEREETARERLIQTGVDGTVSSSASAADIVRIVSDVLRQHSVDRQFDALIDDVDDPERHAAATPAQRRVEGEESALDRGRVIVVLGSDGATEVAVTLAHVLVGRESSTVIVDMDTLEPSVAQRLAMPLTPNIFTATEHLRLRSDINDSFVTHPEGFALIAGIPNPREWENLSEIEAADLIAELASGFGNVVVSASRHLEDLSTFGGTAGRFDVGRRIVTHADDVIVVGSASPLGNARLLGIISDVRQLSPARIHIFVNKAPSDNYIQGEITEEIERTVSISSLVFLPSDTRVQKASWQGDLIRKGPFLKRIAAAADVFVPRTKTRRMRTKSDGASVGESSTSSTEDLEPNLEEAT